MSEPIGTAGLTPQTATEQRAELFADIQFAAAALDPDSEQWQRIVALDGIIAAGRDAEAAADEAEAQARATATQPPNPEGEGEGDDFSAFYVVPDSPAGYELPTQLARDRGLAVDPMAEIELRQSLHSAGVDSDMATTLYWSALNAQTADLSPVAQETQYRATAHELQKSWGKDYEANLKLANVEARRVFDALPASVTGGADFDTFCRASGMANSRLVIERFYQRARARTKGAKA